MMFIECSFKQSGRTLFFGWRIDARGALARAPRYLALFPFPLPSRSPLPKAVEPCLCGGGPPLPSPPRTPLSPNNYYCFCFEITIYYPEGNYYLTPLRQGVVFGGACAGRWAFGPLNAPARVPRSPPPWVTVCT